MDQLYPPHQHTQSSVAYFSMEIGLGNGMPTYSGGLGILAGDTIKAAADLHVPLIGMTLLHEQGYFRQTLAADGAQQESPQVWKPADFMQLQDARITVPIDGRAVRVQAWRLVVPGRGTGVPVYFLDTNLPENDERDRALTRSLYGGDHEYRLRQELILGVGGLRMLQALGLTVMKYHMNEGHSAFLVLELLRQSKVASGVYDVPGVRQRCVFTTHTPVAAGHDAFTPQQVAAAWSEYPGDAPHLLAEDGQLSLTVLALNYADYVNGVAKKHGEVSRHLFPGYVIDHITNGVHSVTWLSPELQAMLDADVPGWRNDSSMLRYAISLPTVKIVAAHAAAKQRLITRLNTLPGVTMDVNTFTIGFARRATAYKRADLLFHDIDRLNALAQSVGAIQVVYAGKAHPRDTEGKEIIKRILAIRSRLAPNVRLCYVPDYDIELAKELVSGVDVWLNTPLKPLEASGTSGMKAAHNGVPSLSILDGWWIEGCLEGMTGWAIGKVDDDTKPDGRDAADAADLYGKLERVILPLYTKEPEKWADIMRLCIAINGSFFNTHRMLQEYVLRAYFQ